MATDLTMHENLMELIDVLWDQRDTTDAIKAKTFYDHLISAYAKMLVYQTKIKENPNVPDFTTWLCKAQAAHTKAITAKIKFEKILSSSKSTPATETKVDISSNPTKQSESVKDSHLHNILKQRFLIKQIESLEILDDICAIKAEVLYSHLSQLYDSFISNQIQIESDTDDDTALDDQLRIATEIQRKVIDFQTKLKKIMQPVATSSTDTSASFDRSIQATQTDTKVKLNLLFQKVDYLIKRINSLEHKKDLSPEEAEAIYNHLNSLYESFNSNLTEIESYNFASGGSALDSQLEVSQEIENKVIELQAKFKKIFAPIKLSSSTQSEALKSEQIKLPESESSLRSIALKLSNLTDFLVSRSSGDENESNINDIYTHLEDTSEISKDIQNKIISLQTTLNKFIDATKQHETNTLEKLDNIFEIIGSNQQEDYNPEMSAGSMPLAAPPPPMNYYPTSNNHLGYSSNCTMTSSTMAYRYGHGAFGANSNPYL